MAALYRTNDEMILVDDNDNYCFLHVTSEEKADIFQKLIDDEYVTIDQTPTWSEGDEGDEPETADEFVERMGGVRVTSDELQEMIELYLAAE